MSEIPRPPVPVAGDETTTLRAFLDHYRHTLRRQADGLDAARLDTRLAPSMLTLGGLLAHLAFVEDWWCSQVLLGRPAAEPWAGLDWDADADAEISFAVGRGGAELDGLLVAAIATSDACVDEALAGVDDEGRTGLDRLAVRERHGERVSLRWILVHLIEEYARHCGHADLLRESIDGTTDL
ncbi:DinB family protein [Nocardioides sp. GY 10127]|uniref:DinB family protein n=1 Tax=Nocardioides sp. GY 10127 TaxID=2569762 RepID=UPI0010A7BA18|nr:DinB family protein [Nocardioides sp. GY 10127]TIC81803.1 DinB family protein [Nocardioides sp. GY 10127]